MNSQFNSAVYTHAIYFQCFEVLRLNHNIYWCRPDGRYSLNPTTVPSTRDLRLSAANDRTVCYLLLLTPYLDQHLLNSLFRPFIFASAMYVNICNLHLIQWEQFITVRDFISLLHLWSRPQRTPITSTDVCARVGLFLLLNRILAFNLRKGGGKGRGWYVGRRREINLEAKKYRISPPPLPQVCNIFSDAGQCRHYMQ
jgi:hypothetical protein